MPDWIEAITLFVRLRWAVTAICRLFLIESGLMAVSDSLPALFAISAVSPPANRYHGYD